jgi:2-polyprenyl-3-methyl-5-hydroxy-6-metoxy-1,4-benzoquinol methylase
MNAKNKTKTTTERVIERYNTVNGRPVIGSGSTEKTIFRSFRRTLGDWLPRDRSEKILDVACGEGALLAFLTQAGYTNLSGFDLSPENVEICHRLGLAFVEKFDALQVAEWKGSEYDVIFAMDILEHIQKEQAAGFLETLRSKLREGGTLILQTPNMGSILGPFHRYNDLSHEFCLTEKSAADLFKMIGFRENEIEIRPSWNATTPAGYLREIYLKLIHNLVFLTEGQARPRIATKNLLIRAVNRHA